MSAPRFPKGKNFAVKIDGGDTMTTTITVIKQGDERVLINHGRDGEPARPTMKISEPDPGALNDLIMAEISAVLAERLPTESVIIQYFINDSMALSAEISPDSIPQGE